MHWPKRIEVQGGNGGTGPAGAATHVQPRLTQKVRRSARKQEMFSDSFYFAAVVGQAEN